MVPKTYNTLRVIGPEHEFSISDEYLDPLPIADKVIKRLCGRIVNNARLGTFVLGNELQAHVLEFKAKEPFENPRIFEETMYDAILQVSELLKKEFNSRLLGLGMHPLLKLSEAKVWSHRGRKCVHNPFILHQGGTRA